VSRLAKCILQGAISAVMAQQFLNHQLECPYCHTIRLRIPADAGPDTPIVCDDCGEFLGMWDDLLIDFEKQAEITGSFASKRAASDGSFEQRADQRLAIAMQGRQVRGILSRSFQNRSKVQG
jgi:hypothetical protein